MAHPAPEPRRITRVMPATQLVALLLAFVLAAGVGGVLTAGLVIPLAAGANSAANAGVELFEEVPDELTPGPLAEQSRIYASDGTTRLATFYAQNRIIVPLDQVSQPMKDAVIAIEDERFYEHGGIDPRGIARAAARNIQGGATEEGASTLTQQYVKNVLIDQALQADDPFAALEAREESLERKLKEAKLAISLEKQMSKDEILQGYLNVAQFGANSIYGVETAARYFFNKSAKDLTAVEAATIAGVTKAPNTFDPTVNPELAQARRDLVLQKMWSLGYLATAELEAAKATPIANTLHITPVPTGCQAAGGSAFFCDYVIKEIIASPEFGETEADRRDLLYRGGLDIITTLDIPKQVSAERAISEAVPVGNEPGLEGVVVTVEPGSGKIVAMAQNVPYNPSKEPPPGTTSVNYAADFTHGGSRGFQPGSTFKPFVLAEWLRSGRHLNDFVSANRVERRVGNFQSPCVGSLGDDRWAPRNADGHASGNISVLQATFNSVNTAYATMGSQLNLCDLRNTAWSMGFRPTVSTIQGKVITQPVLEDIDVTAPMIIGAQETSPLNLAAAFATLASNGTYCEPIALLKVVKADGTELPVPSANCNPNALPGNVAATVTYAMEQVLTQGTARGRGLDGGRPAAGKTGTNQLSAQSWFAGFTRQLSTTVWIGEQAGNNAPHFDIRLNGRFIPTLYGSTVAAPTWQRYMNEAVAGMPFEGFPGPDPNLVGRAPQPRPPANEGGGNGGDGGGGQPGPQPPPQQGPPQLPVLPPPGTQTGQG
jgi:membrane peptidoglycan carboxypeptidase